MILDYNLLFDTAAAITTTTVSTNVIDLAVARDIGIGQANGATPQLMVLVATTFTSTGSGTLAVVVTGSTDNGTFDTYLTSPAYAKTVLTAGTRLLDVDWPRPAAGKSMPRYLRLGYTVATADFSAGAITAALVIGRADRPAGDYPAGINVLN
jgi:hypothetical protein